MADDDKQRLNPEANSSSAETNANDNDSEDVRDQLASRARQQPTARPTGPDLSPPSQREQDERQLREVRPREILEDDDRAWYEKILNMQISMFGPSGRDMAVFCRQLSTLIDVGIPLLQALRILARRTTHPKLRKVASQLALRVEEGNSLSSALKEHPRIFSHLFVSVIEVGELGGILESSLRRLAEVMEMKASMRAKVRSALMYPSAALLVCVAVILLIMGWAVPQFQQIYADLENAELPKVTQRLIAISEFVRDYPQLYIPAVMLLILLGWLFGKTKPGKQTYDWLLLNSYIVGGINTKINVARFTRSVGSLVAAGIPLLESLRVTANTSENVLIAHRLQKVHDSLEQGGRIEEPLRHDTTIPPMVVDMMVIGYEAGAIDDMLLRIADVYDEDVDTAINGLTSIIEPALIIVLGLVIVFLALAMLLPYFNLVTAI